MTRNHLGCLLNFSLICFFTICFSVICLSLTASTAFGEALSPLAHMADDNLLMHVDCPTILKGGDVRSDYSKLLQFMRAQHLDSLLEAIDNGSVIVRLDHDPSIHHDVEWGFAPFSNKRVVYIKTLAAKNDRQWQARIWQVAVAFYEASVAQRLFARDALVAESTITEMKQQSLPFVQAIKFLSQRLVNDWAAGRVTLHSQMQNDLYRLLKSLPLVEPREVLPAFSSRRHWSLDLIAGGSHWGEPRPVPNFADFEGGSGPVRLREIHQQLHKNSFSFHYFVKTLTRASIISMAIYLANQSYHALPYVVQIPHLTVARTPPVNSTLRQDDDFERAYIQYMDKH